MKNFLVVLTVFFFFMLGILLGPSFSNFFQQKTMPIFSFSAKAPIAIVPVKENKGQEIKVDSVQLEQIKKDFPDVVNGVISIDDKEAKVKTTDGKEYLLWPPNPVSVYTYMGIKNGQRVEVQGKILDRNRLQWRIIK